ncbi:reverse transcriptase (RNA-dependent DNA polymerase) [Hirsutella rhossiliensis]|uniref:Reverse transcriptase (RNA-dependent DNA polymerase) domain-containing protein n=1 Tax=Hirsutella rhossiliensis TaxID=111463 RepID=A0A9P8MQ75_9HYPO|nr:reverse transcriptase (RNA-dependent DNA polymerase) domain-containing protein [Hirsutella rhossiliensis]KAH0959077.1 reverse transcriptase (RNA-dependent DNA polymerase) domain-containing protein [Hirsutella rhossiliensis]
MFLGRPWMERNHVVYDAAKQQMYHGRAAVFTAECRRAKRRKKCNAISIHAISLSDIEALQPKPPVDPSEKVPAEVLKEFRDLFSPGEAMKLPPHRPGVDHEVNLQPDKNGNEPPFRFIRASSSAAAAPVLFVRKPNGGLRFCCDYRALNNLAKAKWFTTYLDDVLIYSSGSKADHEAKVRRVLQALADAGLHLDPAKCEFSVQEVKYLGFLGFANYYRIFIPDYAKITQSLDALLKKELPFIGDERRTRRFRS